MSALNLVRTAGREQLYVHAIFDSDRNVKPNISELRSLVCSSHAAIGAEILQLEVRGKQVHLLLAYPLASSTLSLVFEYMEGRTGVLKHSLKLIEKKMNAILKDCFVRIGGWVSIKQQMPARFTRTQRQFEAPTLARRN